MKDMTMLVALLALAGCAEPPKSPMEQRARIAVGMELAAQQCAGYAGGYQGARTMREDANRNMALARNLGATDGVITKARQDVGTTFTTVAAFTSQQEACNSLIGSLAWNA